MTQPAPSLAREFDASLAWWRAAGVDCDFADDATTWLADAPLDAAATAGAALSGAQRTAPSPAGHEMAPQRIVPSPAPAPVAQRRNLLGDSPPPDLAAFRQWWLEAPELGTGGLYPRVAPRGDASAALMVLVPQPEEHDRDRLMEGPQGRLLTNILAAIGLDEASVTIASALPCHTPMADLASLAESGMDAVLTHHIALAAPQRLLVLGTGLAPMLGPQGNQPLREINYNGGKAPVMVSETLDAMMDMPRLKSRFWKRWIEWSASE